MKNAAILAVILSIAGNAAIAESAVNEAPNMTLAFNTISAEQYAAPVNNNISAEALDVKLSNLDKAMEEISIKLNKQLEDKISQDFEYAMH